MKSRHRAMLFASVLPALCACSSLPGHVPSGPTDDTAWHLRQQRLASLDTWQLEGRVGIVNSQDGGSGSLDWQQQGEVLDFNFHGPLGAGALHIQGDADALHVRSSRGDDFVTTDPERDFASLLRVPLPVLSMRYWMLGIPDPHAVVDQRMDSRGELISLSQRGWQVAYLEYAEVQGLSLPVLLTIQRGDVHIKVAVSLWTLPAMTSPPAP
jgi:outer membrane lipoprotein LolB